MSRKIQNLAPAAREQRAAPPRPHTFRGYYEDHGTPGPPPNGNGRAAFDVPRLYARLYPAGERVVVALPREGGKGAEAWTCEIFGVQLPLVPTDPASVRVRLVERFRSATPTKDGRARRKRATIDSGASGGMVKNDRKSEKED